MVVYSELVSNAFRHVTKPGNHVDVTITANTFQLVLEVRDDGPGIDLPRYTEASDVVAKDETARLSGLRMASELCYRLSNHMRDGRHVITAVLDREPVHTIHSLEELNPSDESPVWLTAMPGPRFHRYVDPAKRFAYVAVTTRRIDYVNADDVTYFLKSFKSFDRVIIDASTIFYLDSSGLGTLVRFCKLVLQHGGTVAIVCTKRVADLMRISKLSEVCGVFLSRSEGLRSLLGAS
jgi:anti-anti-sigma factor